MGLLAKATALLEAQKRAAEAAEKFAVSLSKTTINSIKTINDSTTQPIIAKKIAVNTALISPMSTPTQIRVNSFNPEKYGVFVSSKEPQVPTKETTPIKEKAKEKFAANTETAPVIPDIKILNQFKSKLSKLVTGFAITMAAQLITPTCVEYVTTKVQNHKDNTEKLYHINPTAELPDFNFIAKAEPVAPVVEVKNVQESAKQQEINAETQEVVEQAIVKFQQGMESRVSKYDREVLARMLYGEAGRGADPFEILHTVLNRASSPYFKGSLADIVKQKNQYLGYNQNNPLTKDYLTMVDMAIDYWEASGCKKIEGCNHYYFVTGISGICNKFEISPKNNYGKWVPTKDKKYAKMRNYCPVATDQANRYFANRYAYQKAYGHTK
ncbi:MAG: hypothetical protein IKT33_00960 [Clostridia bacterium]|nr:hypothetical protein [Clostridia bacterium]